MKSYYVGWWNLENLFDVFDSPQRPEWLQKELKKELEGWNQTVLNRKIEQLSQIIRQMNQGQGPDLLGVCEIENQTVMELLADSLEPLGRNYAVAHHDTSDLRGIDIGFIYDSDKFSKEAQFFHVVLKRQATRDLFQVNFKTASGRDLILVGNHWPSRSGGQLESEPYRIVAAETLSYWISRILEEKGDEVSVIVLGDFNDEPFNRSVTDYALATNSRTKVLNSKIPRLYNLMWPFLGQGLGTLYYSNFPNVLDQFMVTKSLLRQNAPWEIPTNSVKIERFPEMMARGDYPAPIRFGRPSQGLNENGFSDHYPISLILTEGD
jgi:hypothetical protein